MIPIPSQIPLATTVRHFSNSPTRVWKLRHDWGLILSNNIFTHEDMSITMKAVYNNGSDSNPNFMLIDSPNLISLYINKTWGYFYIRMIGYPHGGFLASTGWGSTPNSLIEGHGYIDEVSVEELTLELADYSLAYDAPSNTLYILFRDKILGVINSTGVISKCVLDEDTEYEDVVREMF